MSEALNLLQDDVIFSLQVNGEEAGLHVQWIVPDRKAPGVPRGDPGARHVAPGGLAAERALADPALRFHLPEPRHHDGYKLVFPASRRYQQRAFGFWFKASELQTPVSRDEAALRVYLTDAYTQIISPPRTLAPWGRGCATA